MRNSCQTLAAKSVALQTIAARLLCLAALSLLMPVAANANPQNGKVVAGSANIAQSGSNTLKINQQSQKAIINWQSFSIASGQTTNFIQPSASAITLNRVTGVDPSSIMGNLNANGQVWLINPNGIAFSKSARVDVAGLLATTIDIADQDFLSGNYKFTGLADPNAMVTNEGKITIRDAGLAALVAPGVSNSGVIQADLGQIQLSSAAAFTIDFYGDGLFNFTLDKQVTQAIKNANAAQPDAAVTNTGKLIANGGRIALTANVASSVVSNSINMSGYAQATTAKVSNGQIVLDGGDEGDVQVTGSLNAFGTQSGQTGGLVEVTGANVNFASTAKLNASGYAGGGTVLIGGAEHGAGALRNALTTTIAKGATITADATHAGNGGQVVVWSNEQTNYAGTISAKGGSESGDGGAAEVSSHGVLGFGGTVDLTAAFGSVGSLLLDPENVIIEAAGSNTVSSSMNADGPLYTGNTDNWILTTATLQNALASANVTVATGTSGSQAGDIEVASTLSWASGYALTLSAYRNIVIDDSVVIANTGAGDLNLRADNTGAGSGTVVFNGVARVDWAGSTGTVSLFYNPDNPASGGGGFGEFVVSAFDSPAGSTVNPTSYTSPTNYSSYVLTNASVPNQFMPYMLVNSVYDLQNIQNNLASNYALGTDIDATATAGWNAGAGFIPLGNSALGFSGVLDGLGYSITNLTISSSAIQIGVFGTINRGAVVQNLTLTNANITGTLANGSEQFIGTLAGQNSGTLIHVAVSGYATGAPANFDDVGGLLGQNSGTVSLSTSASTVSGYGNLGGLIGDVTVFNNEGESLITSQITHSAASGNVTGSGDVGGFVGDASYGTISDSYSTGAVTSTGIGDYVGGFAGYEPEGDISDSYAAGTVIGGDNSAVGGFIGLQGYGNVENSYATGNVTGGSGANAGGFIGWLGGGYLNVDGIESNSFATGNVTAGDNSNVGGFVGYLNGSCSGLCYGGTIRNVYSTGNVEGGGSSNVGGFVGYSPGGIIQAGYSTGSAVGGPQSSIGGFDGSNYEQLDDGSANISSAYWDTTTSETATGIGGLAYTYGPIGLTTTQLKSQLPLGFDPSVWAISSSANRGYPYLLALGEQVTVIPLTWSVADASSTYGTLATPGKISFTGLASGDIGSVGGTIELFQNANETDPVTLSSTLAAGRYYEAVTGLTGIAAGNYTLSSGDDVVGTLTIDQAPLTVTANNLSRYLSQPNPPLTYTITMGTLVGGDTLTGSLATSANASSPQGNYPITQGSLSASSNYTVTFLPGTLLISLSQQDVTLSDQTISQTSRVQAAESATTLSVVPMNANSMAIQVLNSLGVKYLTNPAVTDLLTDLLEQLPWQYLSQSEFETELVQKLQQENASDFNESITRGQVGIETLGLIAGVVIGVLHDQLIAKGWPPVVVEELTLAATGTVNYELALRVMGNPDLAAADAVVQTTVGELLNTGEAWYSWDAQRKQNLLQVQQLLAEADALHSAAESVKNQPGMGHEYSILMNASVAESQNAAALAANASGYQSNGNIVSAFWNSLW